MGAEALPKRDQERATNVCNGAVALAELADRRGLSIKLAQYFGQLEKPGLLPQILESVRRERHSIRCGNREFLNCLLGGFRPGFSDTTQLCAETLEAHLEKEHAQRFPREESERDIGFPSRSNHIKRVANKKGQPGLHVTFHHWADLALEMWGDLIELSDDFHIELMIVAKDAYSIDGVRNAALHRYYDSIATWRNLFQVLIQPTNPRPSYRSLAGQGTNPIGVIDYLSPVGKALRLWKVWPTNAIPYLRNWPDALGALPREITNDPMCINLLAYQIWLLRPENILVLGTAHGETMKILDQAIELITSSEFQLPFIYCVPHSSGSPFFIHGPAILKKLRTKLSRLI